MKIYKADMPKENYGSYDDCELDEYSLKRAEDFGAEKIIYWYGSGSYCGTGQALIKKDGEWYLQNMSHCSCYGPLEDLSLITGKEKLEEWKDTCSKEYIEELKPLLDLAKSKKIK